MEMRIVFFGTYVLSDAYPVNKVLYEGTRAAAHEVQACRVELWQGFLHRAFGGGLGHWLRWSLRALGGYARLLWQYLRCGEHAVVVVGYPGYLDIVVARLLNLFSRRLLVLVSFISLYDTVVLDRGRVGPQKLRARLLYALDRLAFRCADWVLVDTQALATYYAELFDLPLNTFRKSMVGNVFDRFQPVVWQQREDAVLRVLFFGTYVPLHGAEFIVEAAEVLRAAPVEFTLIGQGQDFETVRRRAGESGLEHIRFVEEWYSVEQLAEAMRQADVCLGIFGATAKAARVIPYKVFGALALARPVITRDSPAIRELLVDGESALLCPAADGEALAASIERLRAEPDLCQQLGQNGYARYQAHATREAIGRDFVEALKGEVDQRGR